MEEDLYVKPPTLSEIKKRIASAKRVTREAKKRLKALKQYAAAVDAMCEVSRQIGAEEEKIGII
jgi:hypothetical protein